MKVLALIQRVIALVTLIIGILLMFSEVPVDQSVVLQAWVTVGGFTITILSLGWLFLIRAEEKLFIEAEEVYKDETR